METIEQENKEPLVGEYEPQTQHQKLFLNLSAASDFVISFGIRNYQIRDGYMSDGQYVVQVSYQRNQ